MLMVLFSETFVPSTILEDEASSNKTPRPVSAELCCTILLSFGGGALLTAFYSMTCLSIRQ